MSEHDECVPNRHPGKTDVPVEEARRIMDAAQYRLVDREQGGRFPAKWNGVEIFHDGKWKTLSRTDLCDDVGTTSVITATLEQWCEAYKARINYGARFDEQHFSVIDAYSDG